jgi:amylosucrase
MTVTTAHFLPHDAAHKTLQRLIPRLEQRFAHQLAPEEWEDFSRRLRSHFPDLFAALMQLYGQQYDFFFHLESILVTITEKWNERPGELKALDAMREVDPDWFRSNRLVGAMCYVDLFAGDLSGLIERIPYLTELGITYLHLMPLFKVPEGDNDGGYAVSDYRQVDERLGTMEQLVEVAQLLRHHGISLALDFVLNHTSDEHEWAQRAAGGEVEYQSLYRMFPNRTLPDAYEDYLPTVFPDDHPGAFTYHSRAKKWIWTTFHNYQWDLNYENAEVFNRMVGEMLFLANQGVEVLRLDAVAFLWKELGSNCQNLPGAHAVIQAFSAVTKIASPAVVLKSEAIVNPEEVRKYISREECQLSYNPELTALLWNSLATRTIKILRNALQRHFALPPDCDWVNYVRCHDDIGWAFSDEDIRAAGFDPIDHRRFLNQFFTGSFTGSFAHGLPFQENPLTGDARVSGTTASLVGLEAAVRDQDEHETELAIRRIFLLHGVVMTIGGIPLIYLGDEIATPNNYDFRQHALKIADSRWVHRSLFDWQRAEHRHDPETIAGRVFQGMLQLIQLRKRNLAFDRAETEIIDTENDHVLGYFRVHSNFSVLVLANFSEQEQAIEGRRLRHLGLQKTVIDMLAGSVVTATQAITLEPYQFVVLARLR